MNSGSQSLTTATTIIPSRHIKTTREERHICTLMAMTVLEGWKGRKVVIGEKQQTTFFRKFNVFCKKKS